MSERTESRVGVRELRQNLSVYLDRVKAGESLVVTERGAAVAQMTPLSRGRTTIEQLVASGRASGASGSLLELGPPPPIEGETLTTTLLRLRDEET